MFASLAGGWKQPGPKSVASRTPFQRARGTGGFQRSGPTGGCANGMPLNTRTLPSVVPRTAPAGAFTCGAGAVVALDIGEFGVAFTDVARTRQATEIEASGRREIILRLRPRGEVCARARGRGRSRCRRTA